MKSKWLEIFHQLTAEAMGAYWGTLASVILDSFRSTLRLDIYDLYPLSRRQRWPSAEIRHAHSKPNRVRHHCWLIKIMNSAISCYLISATICPLNRRFKYQVKEDIPITPSEMSGKKDGQKVKTWKWVELLDIHVTPCDCLLYSAMFVSLKVMG